MVIEKLKALSVHLKATTGIPVMIEPNVTSPAEPHFKIIPKRVNPCFAEGRKILIIKFDLLLYAEGENEAFIDILFDKSIKVNEVFENHYRVQVSPELFVTITRNGQYGNADNEEGFNINSKEGRSFEYYYHEAFSGELAIIMGTYEPKEKIIPKAINPKEITIVE